MINPEQYPELLGLPGDVPAATAQITHLVSEGTVGNLDDFNPSEEQLKILKQIEENMLKASSLWEQYLELEDE